MRTVAQEIELLLPFPSDVTRYIICAYEETRLIDQQVIDICNAWKRWSSLFWSSWFQSRYAREVQQGRASYFSSFISWLDYVQSSANKFDTFPDMFSLLLYERVLCIRYNLDSLQVYRYGR